MSDIFLSYSRQDSEFVETLIMALINHGWSVWSDKIAISEGKPYDEQTEQAIGEATVTLVVWSRHSVKSRWVRAEAAYALERNKLVPLISEDVDPPLQFLHIQAINLASWDKTNDDLQFKRLAGALSRRLDRVRRGPKTNNAFEEAGQPDATPQKEVSAFRESFFPTRDPGFDSYFTNRTFYIAQIACGFAVFLVTIFGLIDVLSQASAGHTVFRLLVEAPICLIFLALSFLPLARRHAQSFSFAFGMTILMLIFMSAQRMEATFPVTTGAATTVFLVALTLFTILPLKAPNALILGLLTVGLHYAHIKSTHVFLNPGLLGGYNLCVVCGMLTLVAVAYLRERGMRHSFRDHQQSTAKIAELRERVMTLAVQQKSTKTRASNKTVRDNSMVGPLDE